MKVLKKLGSGYVAQFDCHLRPFMFHIDLDGNMPPQTVSLLFEEANEQGLVLADPIRFTVKMAARGSWEIEPDPTRSRQQRILAREFSNDLSAGVLPWILERIKAEGYDEDARLSAFRMSSDDIAGGILVSYTEVMTYGEEDESPPWFGYDLTHGTQRYLIDDRYCPNPRCDCRAVNLDFHTVLVKKTKPACLLSVGFDDQRMEVQDGDRRPCSKSHARALLDRLLAEEPGLLAECQRRYEKIRQTTKRLFEEHQRPLSLLVPRAPSHDRIVPAAPPLASARIGRNSPCPCGSGKKYKHCCAGR